MLTLPEPIYSLRDVARHLGISHEHVRRHAKKLGVRLRHGSRSLDSETVRRIVESIAAKTPVQDMGRRAS